MAIAKANATINLPVPNIIEDLQLSVVYDAVDNRWVIGRKVRERTITTTRYVGSPLFFGFVFVFCGQGDTIQAALLNAAESHDDIRLAMLGE